MATNEKIDSLKFGNVVYDIDLPPDNPIKTTVDNLKAVATSGNHNDLINTPNLNLYKTKQTAVSDPTASGNSTSFIATIS